MAKKSPANEELRAPLTLEWRSPSELADNPQNWRTHPKEQTDGLEAVMRELAGMDDGDTSGPWAGVLLYNDRTQRLVDGHARKGIRKELLVDGELVGRPGEKVAPVLRGRWTEEQEALILATLDPLAAMAQSDESSLQGLLDAIETEDEEVALLLERVSVMEWNAETVLLEALVPHPRNYREHPEDQLEHLCQSLSEHGFYRRLVIAADGTILIGHGIAQAARMLDIRVAPALRMSFGPDDPRALKILAADNEVEHLADVDDRARSELLLEVKDAEGAGLLGTGFDERMLALLAMVTRPEEEIEDFDAAAHWAGLPDYQQMETVERLIVSFDSIEAKQLFCKEKLGIEISAKTRGIRYPIREREDASSLEWYDPEDEPPEGPSEDEVKEAAEGEEE